MDNCYDKQPNKHGARNAVFPIGFVINYHR